MVRGTCAVFRSDYVTFLIQSPLSLESCERIRFRSGWKHMFGFMSVIIWRHQMCQKSGFQMSRWSASRIWRSKWWHFKRTSHFTTTSTIKSTGTAVKRVAVYYFYTSLSTWLKLFQPWLPGDHQLNVILFPLLFSISSLFWYISVV